jgi:hypothetical protein
MLKLLDRNETPAEWWSCGLHGAKVLTMDAEANDPARVLIHDHQNPVGPQHGRFAPEQIHAPEAVSHVAQERQPGGTVPQVRVPKTPERMVSSFVRPGIWIHVVQFLQRLMQMTPNYHGKNNIGTIRIQLFCQVIHFAGVRRFGEAQLFNSSSNALCQEWPEYDDSMPLGF